MHLDHSMLLWLSTQLGFSLVPQTCHTIDLVLWSDICSGEVLWLDLGRARPSYSLLAWNETVCDWFGILKFLHVAVHLLCKV